MSAEKWVVRLYRDNECFYWYRSRHGSIDDVIKVMVSEYHPYHRHELERADFICVQPEGNTFASRTLQLERAWDLSQQREEFQSNE